MSTALPFDWNHLRALLAVAERGSLTAAAQALRTTQPTVGRQLAALEEALGVALVERVGRGVALTQAGQDMVEQARDMAEAARRVERVASGRSTALEGVVTVSMSETFAAFVLPALVKTLRAVAPDVQLTVVATSQVSDLRRGEADIALRHVRPSDPELVARRLPDGAAHWYGTRGLVAALGNPGPGDLDGVPLVGWAPRAVFRDRLLAMGMQVDERAFVLASENHLVQWAMARAGLGLAVMEARVGEADPEMTRALPWFPPIPVPMWLTSHREVHTSRRVRLVYDHLAEAFSGG
jgi:DNA-binding transcriptional LysR family regulator